MCSLNNLDRGKRLSIQPKSPVVSTVFSPAMKRFLLYLYLTRQWFYAGYALLFSSTPMMTCVPSDDNSYGGTSRLSGAGTFLYTRPARSNAEPWQGQKKPPSQLAGRPGPGPAARCGVGEQPRWVQMPTATQYLGS